MKLKKKQKTAISIIIILSVLIGILAYSGGLNFFLSSVTTEDFAQPNWARLECQPTDGYEPEGGIVKHKYKDTNLWLDCNYNVQECEINLDTTDPGWWSSSVLVTYQKYQIGGGSIGPLINEQSYSAGVKDTPLKDYPKINRGESILIKVVEKDYFGLNTEADFRIKIKPWKIFRYVGGQKTIAKSSDCCFANSFEDFKDQIPKDSPLPSCLTFTGGEGSKWVNYVDSWVKGYANNVYTHPNYGEVYCSGGRIYSIVKLTTKDGKLTKINPEYINKDSETQKYVAKGMGNILPGVECCPQEPNCGMDFKRKPQPIEGKTCFSDVECYNSGGPVPIDKKNYKKETCIKNICTWSELIPVECTNNVACPNEKPICDLSTYNYGKCVVSISNSICGDRTCDPRTESENNCEEDCGERSDKCKLNSPEECGNGIFNLCDKDECENCGWYFEENKIGIGGACSKEKPLGICKSCDDYAFSYLLSSVFPSKKCDSKGWTLEWSLFFISPPQGEFRCGLSIAKLLLVPIIFIFTLLFSLDYVVRFRALKSKKRGLIRFFISMAIAGLISYLVYTLFFIGILAFIIFVIIKIGIKSIL